MKRELIIESISKVCRSKEEAEVVFLECIKENALRDKEVYTKEEVIKICNSLKKRGKHLAVIAGVLAAKAFLS